MGYQLRLHSQIRRWLTDLRDAEPEFARAVGEAMLALIDAGDALGPPLVVPVGSVLRQPEDPREALDYSYQRQLEMLTSVRRGVADVATSRRRVELQAASLERHAASLGREHEEALGAGREDLAEVAARRAPSVREQLSWLRRQALVLTADEEKLTLASQRLQRKVEAFRIRKETIKASYTAAEASQSARDAMAGLDAEAGDLEAGDQKAAGPEAGGPEAGDQKAAGPEAGDQKAGNQKAAGPEAGDQKAGDAGAADQKATDAGAADAGAADPAAAAGDRFSFRSVRVGPAGYEVLREIQGQVPSAEDATGLGGREGVPVPNGMMELRPEAPGDMRASLLFVVAPQGTATVVAYATDPGGSHDDYQDAIRIAAERLPAADGPDAAAAPDDAFTSYDADAFLDEFFPGAETEVEIGAGALVARSRAHTLAEARQRMRLTQAQVARRMSVRQERVSAIERAEPGATEVRTLAAYVGALGGRLEIVAHIGDERIILR
jgi:phage shock protein A/DNA-binding XRE family transcriptional regulator